MDSDYLFVDAKEQGQLNRHKMLKRHMYGRAGIQIAPRSPTTRARVQRP
jgi:transposase